MKLTAIHINPEAYPAAFQPLFIGAKAYDSSCSSEARVIFIDKDGGHFLKSAAKGALEREAAMTRFFHGKGLAARVIAYVSGERDWLLTEKIPGDDCVAEKYLREPKRLCDITAERLALLHASDCSGCPVMNHTERYLAKAARNKTSDIFDKSLFPDSWGYASAEEAWAVVEARGHLLEMNTLLHGDYCLPNTLLDDWRFAGHVDLGDAGVGDRHVDLFWGIWTLFYNLKTDQYSRRFIDAYGRDRVDEDLLRVVAAVEVFL